MQAAGIGVFSTVLLVTGVGQGAASAATAPGAPATPAAVRTYSGGSLWYLDDGGQFPDPWSGATGNSSATAVSTTATRSQSAGVVLINTVLGYQSGEAAGTGMVLSSSGEVLTNYHVVEGATTIRVTVASTGKAYRATVVGRDQRDDIAVLRLTNASGLARVKVDTGTVSAGEAVTAVGNAGGTGTLSAAPGTLTATTATVTTADEGTVASETLTKLLETDADVVAGDSGGPLYDAQGQVVGIDTAASTGAQIDGYAIPIQAALAIAHQIESGTASSTVRIGPAAFLGVELSDTAASYAGGYPGADAGQSPQPTAGALVGGVLQGTPAARAGLSAGDTITAVNGAAVSSAADLSTVLAKYRSGQSVTIRWSNQAGTQHTAKVTLAANPVA